MKMQMSRVLAGAICCLTLVATGNVTSAQENDVSSAQFDSRNRATAVALNYCRASFHRIRRHQVTPVLIDEEEKILNNLNLNGIADDEIIKLYTACLDEIAQIQVADTEREYFRKKYRYGMRQNLAFSALAITSQVATMQFASAVRTGANSWWDYRASAVSRDMDVFKIEKQRVNQVVNKSSQFLDTFWKMAKEKNIPDRWLVRGDDLDRLEEAMQEADPQVRLRILKRMEPFMECYPPYWYYVARTQQSLGQLFAAAATYDHLADLGSGHFRKDEMLAAALANRAMIQEYLGQPGAVRTAREALRYATQVPDANLMAAQVLARHGIYDEAEEALLRNLDVNLERPQSLACLLSIYCQNKDQEAISRRLSRPEDVVDAPVPVLLTCLHVLGIERAPASVMTHIAQSLVAEHTLRFGRDDFLVRAAPSWHLDTCQATVTVGTQTADEPCVAAEDGNTTMSFRQAFEFGNPLGRPRPEDMTATLHLNYADGNDLRIELRPTIAPTTGVPVVIAADRNAEPTNLQARFPAALRISSISANDMQLLFNRAEQPASVPATPGVVVVPPGSPTVTPMTEPAAAPKSTDESPAPPASLPPKEGTPAGPVATTPGPPSATTPATKPVESAPPKEPSVAADNPADSTKPASEPATSVDEAEATSTVETAEELTAG